MIKQLLTWADHHLDLGDPVSIERAVGRTVETLERLDVLVANAVRWPLDARAPLAEVDHAAWTRALRRTSRAPHSRCVSRSRTSPVRAQGESC